MSQSGSLSAAGGGGIDLLELTGDTGGVVNPDVNGNINIVGQSGVITVAGNPGTNTLTINIDGTSQFSVQTTDATPTLLATVPVAANEAVTVSISVIAPQSTYATAIGGNLTVVARNSGGGTTIVGNQGNLLFDSGGAPAMTFAGAGTNLNIYVTGVGAMTYDWLATLRVIYN